MEQGFEILYEEGPCLVVSKPAGLLTQAPPGIDSLEARIKRFLKHREGKTGNVYLGMPHRLDRPATGALVVARHVRAARRLSDQFEGRTIRKVYWALVEGIVRDDRGTWTDHLRKIPDVARSEVVAEGHPEGRLAILHFRVFHRHESQSWLEIQLETGRNHQIRVQAASHGHPLLGDELYGSRQPFGIETRDPRERQIALHARELGFEHPMTRQPVSITAPLPITWDKDVERASRPVPPLIAPPEPQP
jgi:23S rRNA pseudouridine1911/1915/1917 synthase